MPRLNIIKLHLNKQCMHQLIKGELIVVTSVNQST